MSGPFDAANDDDMMCKGGITRYPGMFRHQLWKGAAVNSSASSSER